MHTIFVVISSNLSDSEKYLLKLKRQFKYRIMTKKCVNLIFLLNNVSVGTCLSFFKENAPKTAILLNFSDC